MIDTPPNLEFVGTCVHLEAGDLHAYDDSEEMITYHRFRHYVGEETIKEWERNLGYEGSGLTLEEDQCVSFSQGKWKGEWAVCMYWSAIHHIWIIDNG